MQYELSKEVEKVAERLIKQFHDELKGKDIRYVTQEKKDDKTGQSVAQMRKGRPVLADIKVVGGLNAFLCSGEERTDLNGPIPFAVMVVSKHAWNLLKPKQREAMLDEQLCRLDYDSETGKPTVGDYDVHAITLNAKRFGAWNDDLDRFLTAAQDFPLFRELDEAVTEPKPKVVKASAGTGKIVDPDADAKATEPPKPDLPSITEHANQKRGRTRPATAGR
jgi:hypothetical protein